VLDNASPSCEIAQNLAGAEKRLPGKSEGRRRISGERGNAQVNLAEFVIWRRRAERRSNGREKQGTLLAFGVPGSEK
jgi:hypothetical protein